MQHHLQAQQAPQRITGKGIVARGAVVFVDIGHEFLLQVGEHFVAAAKVCALSRWPGGGVEVVFLALHGDTHYYHGRYLAHSGEVIDRSGDMAELEVGIDDIEHGITATSVLGGMVAFRQGQHPAPLALVDLGCQSITVA